MEGEGGDTSIFIPFLAAELRLPYLVYMRVSNFVFGVNGGPGFMYPHPLKAVRSDMNAEEEEQSGSEVERRRAAEAEAWHQEQVGRCPKGPTLIPKP